MTTEAPRTLCAGTNGTYTCPARRLCKRYDELMQEKPDKRPLARQVQLFRQPSTATCDKFERIVR